MRPTILYLDDEMPNLMGFKSSLYNEYDIHIADSVKAAEQILSENEIHILIADQRMPDENGLDFLRRIAPMYPEMVSIVLTAYIDMDATIQAINQGGVYRFMLKPWELQEMKMTLENAYETYSLRRQNKNLVNDLKKKNDELTTIVNDLLQSEEKFRNIFNSTSEGIIIIDSHQRVIDANRAVGEMTGYSMEEVTNLEIKNFLLEEYHQVQQERFEKLQQMNLPEQEFSLKCKDGRILNIEAKSDRISYNGKNALLTVFRDISAKKEVEKQLYIAGVQAEENERGRLAKELHDGLGPLLSTCKIYLHDLKGGVPKEKEQTVSKISEIINEALESIKEISNNISPHILRNFGLFHAVRSFIEKSSGHDQVSFNLDYEIEERFDQIIELTLYRILTELINNTLKYANAQNIVIRVSKTDNVLSVLYSDDGDGFNYGDTLERNKGFGLINISSRMKSIKGKLNYESSPGGGVTVNMELNL